MDKKVFISHSSKDKALADQICQTIENKGIGCWIAPRDIPYGNEWAGEITKALRQAKICIFLFSKNSNQSKQVAKEIQIAIDNEVIIIPIRVENVEMNDVLTYYLATMHWLLEYDEKTLLDRIDSALSTTKATQPIENADAILQGRLDEYFPSDKISASSEKSAGQQRVKEKISKKHFDRLIDNLEKNNTIKEDSTSETPMASKKNGKHFSIINNEDQITIAFEVVPVLNANKKAFVSSYMEELDYTDEKLTDEYTRRTFYVNYCYYYGVPICTKLVLVTFYPKEKYLLISDGVIDGSKVIISKVDTLVESWDNENDKTAPECNYTIDGRTAHIEYTANDKSDIIIISLETFEVIKRQKQFDSTIGDWKTTIKLNVEKPYFVIKTQYVETPANEMLVALGYLHGLWGLPHNVLKAIELLENDASAEAKFVLAKIFKNDDMLKDDNDYIYYLTQSANLGYSEAMLRLSNEYIDGVCINKDYTQAKKLLEDIVLKEPENGTAWNNLGWLYKNGYGCQLDYFEACRLLKKAVECGSKKAFKHLAEIALLSNAEVVSYNEGLYYLCCAKKLEVTNLDDIFDQYSDRLEDYLKLLEDAEQKAFELPFEEFVDIEFTVEDTTDSVCLIGGFTKWN